ncbi:helix-turn-helix domain-containing protein [Nocardia farcinica]
MRAELARRTLTQAQLAEMSGLKPTYLGDRLRDTVALDLNDIEAIARAFGLSPLELMERAERATASLPRPAAAGEGPLVTSEGSFTAAQSPEDDRMLRRTRARRSSER